jgi:hypothetical protein
MLTSQPLEALVKTDTEMVQEIRVSLSSGLSIILCNYWFRCLLSIVDCFAYTRLNESTKSKSDPGWGDAEAGVRQLQQVHHGDRDHPSDEARRAWHGSRYGGRTVRSAAFLFCFVLCCFVFVLFCFVLFCFVLFCFVLFFPFCFFPFFFRLVLVWCIYFIYFVYFILLFFSFFCCYHLFLPPLALLTLISLKMEQIAQGSLLLDNILQPTRCKVWGVWLQMFVCVFFCHSCTGVPFVTHVMLLLFIPCGPSIFWSIQHRPS